MLACQCFIPQRVLVYTRYHSTRGTKQLSSGCSLHQEFQSCRVSFNKHDSFPLMVAFMPQMVSFHTGFHSTRSLIPHRVPFLTCFRSRQGFHLRRDIGALLQVVVVLQNLDWIICTSFWFT
jgi:hypothetical protein